MKILEEIVKIEMNNKIYIRTNSDNEIYWEFDNLKYSYISGDGWTKTICEITKTNSVWSNWSNMATSNSTSYKSERCSTPKCEIDYHMAIREMKLKRIL